MENFVLQGLNDQVVSKKCNLDDIAVSLKNLLDLRASSVVEIFRSYSFLITDKTVCVDQSVLPTLPWISCSIANDGPGDVFVFINSKTDIRDHESIYTQRSNTTPLIMGETKEYSGESSVIEKLYLQCGQGYTANIRIFTEGKRPVKVQEVGA